jgi:hypothetical protein
VTTTTKKDEWWSLLGWVLVGVCVVAGLAMLAVGILFYVSLSNMGSNK